MATTLEARAEAPADPGVPQRNERIDVQEGPPIGALPQRYAFREIDFYIDPNGHLQFCFRNSGLAQALGNQTIEQIATALRAPAQPEPEFLVATAFEEPPQTPLDLKVTGDPIYIIYRLYGPRNMTFDAAQKALSHKDGAAMNRYGLLRHLGPAGAGSPASVPNCRLIYFACVPGAGNYRDRFNLRVELEETPIPGNPPERRTLVLEIDPDVGYPGGSPTN
jgi:hypothetical protein